MSSKTAIPVINGLSSGFLKNAARYTAEKGRAYGSFYCMKFPFRSVFVTTEPDIFHHVFILNDHRYIKSTIYWQQLRKVIGDSIGTLEGNDWMSLRNIEHPFYKPTAVHQSLGELKQIITRHVKSWEKMATGDSLFDITAHVSKMNIEAILQLIFGIKKNQGIEKIIRSLGSGEDIIAWRSKYPWRPFLGWITGHNYPIRKNLAVFDSLIKEHFAGADENAMAVKIYNGLPEDLNHEKKLKRLRNEMIVHLGAGTETTAVSISWIFYLLVRHPDILIQTENEILSGESYTYTEQVIDEALRLYPSSHALVRDCIEDDVINTVKIKKGAILYGSVYGIHRNPAIWNDPDKFDPERFSSDNKTSIKPYHYLPFGAGKHTCIGRYLAKPIILQAVIEIIKHFKVSSHTQTEIFPLSLATLKPAEKIILAIKKR